MRSARSRNAQNSAATELNYVLSNIVWLSFSDLADLKRKVRKGLNERSYRYFFIIFAAESHSSF